MTSPYRLLIIGHHKPISEAFLSVQVLTHHATQAFISLPHVHVVTKDISCLKRENTPQAEVAIVVSYWDEFDANVNAYVKEQTGGAVTLSLREVPFPVDHSFVFKPIDDSAATYIPLPCEKRLMTRKPKASGSILVDHAWMEYVNTDRGWTTRIENWLRPIAAQHAISEMVYYKDSEHHHIPSFITPFPTRPYLQYLKDTSHVERFICTHSECYPHGVIDMAARGTQVIAPQGLLPECIVDSIGVLTFTTQDELLAILDSPVGSEWDTKINLMTDYADIAETIDGYIQTRLHDATNKDTLVPRPYTYPTDYETPACNLCGHHASLVLIDNAKGTNMALVECTQCGFRFFSPRPRWSVLKDLIADEKVQAENLYRWCSFTEVPDVEVQKANVSSYYSLMMQNCNDVLGRLPQSMFEVAPCVGWLAVEARKFGIPVIDGIDLNVHGVAICNEKQGLPGIVAGDFLTYEPHRKYEMVAALDYLEHTYHPKQDLRKIADMLEPGGVFLGKTFLDEYDTKREMLAPPCHSCHWTELVLRRELANVGLDVKHWRMDYGGFFVIFVAQKIRESAIDKP